MVLPPDSLRPMRPVEARLQKESVDASEEQEASIDKLDRRRNSLRVSEGPAPEEDGDPLLFSFASAGLPGLGEEPFRALPPLLLPMEEDLLGLVSDMWAPPSRSLAKGNGVVGQWAS